MVQEYELSLPEALPEEEGVVEEEEVAVVVEEVAVVEEEADLEVVVEIILATSVEDWDIQPDSALEKGNQIRNGAAPDQG